MNNSHIDFENDSRVNSVIRNAGIEFEAYYWEQKLSDPNRCKNYFQGRLNQELEIESDLSRLLPKVSDESKIRILDVGCGPISSIGRKQGTMNIEITGVDPLADEYKSILDKMQIVCPHRVIQGGGEDLSNLFSENYFDLIYSCNALDHSMDPKKCIEEMCIICKPNGYICLDVFENEALNENYSGFHQWNFTQLSEDICIYNKSTAYLLSDVIRGMPFTFKITSVNRKRIYNNSIRIYIHRPLLYDVSVVELKPEIHASYNPHLNTITLIKGKKFKNASRFFLHFKKGQAIVESKSFYWDTSHDMFSVRANNTEYDSVLIGQYEYSYKNQEKKHVRFWEILLNM